MLSADASLGLVMVTMTTARCDASMSIVRRADGDRRTPIAEVVRRYHPAGRWMPKIVILVVEDQRGLSAARPSTVSTGGRGPKVFR